MAERTAVLHYRTDGTERSTAQVISLAEAQARLRQRTAEMAPVMRDQAAGIKLLDGVSSSATAKISSLTNTLGPLGAGLGTVSREAPRAAMGLLQYISAAERATLLTRTLNTAILTGASGMLVGAVATASYADNAIRAGDSYATLQARIKTFTESAAEAAAIEEKLYDTAAEARTPVRELTTLWARLSPAVRDYGKSQQDAMTITALTSKALAIQGADIREQAAATIQFSQAIASGVMRGDELRSLLESSPQLLRYISQNLEINGKIGVAFSQLRKLGEEGALSTDKIIDSLLRAKPQIEADFINAPKTAQQYWQVLQDQITRTIGQMGQASGAHQGLVAWLADLGKKADEFREKMIMDPRALDPVKEATRFIGDAVGTIGKLGGAAAEHFDEIVAAGQLIIALKLGEVFASWFAAAARGAQTAVANLQAFRAAARFNAGATLDRDAADAARSLRGAAVGLEARAAEQAAIAEQKLAVAKAARAAADRAAAEAAKISTLHGATSTMATEAQTRATAMSTVAKRAEDQANKALIASQNTMAAATVRATMAAHAEGAVTANVTRGKIALNAAMRIGLGLYNLMGGALGVATLALGGLIYAVWRAKEAEEAKNQAMLEAVDVTDRLRALTNEMTSASWAQVPALLAQAQMLRENAAAAREEAAEQLALAQARLKARQQLLGLNIDDGGAAAYAAARAERDVGKKEKLLEVARNGERNEMIAAEALRLGGLAREAGSISSQLQTGKDAAGRPLTSDGREGLERRRQELFRIGQAQVDHWQRQLKDNQDSLKGLTGAAKEGRINGIKLVSETFEAAASLVSMADTPSTARPASPAKPAGKSTKPPATPGLGRVGSAYDELLRQEFYSKAGADRFDVGEGGSIVDRVSGGNFKARSEDEAKAAADYVAAVSAITRATDAEIAAKAKEYGVQVRSREALKEAASARLAHAVETSKATRADERWAEIQAEMTGDSRAVIKAQRDINNLIADGTVITDEAAKAYLDFIKAREAGKRAADALQFNAQHARDAYSEVMAGTVVPVTARGLPDVEAQVRMIEERREQIIVESERRIREATRREVELGQMSAEEGERKLADRIAANKVSVEILLQEDLEKIRQGGRQASAEADEAEANRLTEMVINLGKETGAGAGKDAAKNFLKALADELAEDKVWDPLRKILKDKLEKLMDGKGIAGLLSQGIDALWGLITGGGKKGGGGGGGGGSGWIATAGKAIGSFFGFSSGGWTGDGPADEVAGAVHGQEFVVKAGPARQNRGFLERLNAGLVDPEKPSTFNGGFLGNHPQYMPDPRAGIATAVQAIARAEREAGERATAGTIVELHNHSSQPVEARATTENGVTKIDLYDQVGRGMMKQGAKDPQVRKAFGASTPPVRRTR